MGGKIYVDGTLVWRWRFFLRPSLSWLKAVDLCCLLPDKLKVTYNRMLELILGAWPNLQPTMISMDLRLFSRMIPGVVFVLPNHLANAIEVLREKLPDELDPIIDYLEHSYIGR